MTGRQRQKRQEDTGVRTQSAPVAEAIAIGTAAGGLVIGTMQAAGNDIEPAKVENNGLSRDERDVGGHGRTATATADPAPGQSQHLQIDASHTGQPEAIASAPLQQAPPADATAPVIAEAGPAPAFAEASTADANPVVANTIDLPPQSQLVADLSEQITATLAKVIGNVDSGLSASDLGQSIASDIIHSAQDIVARIDAGPRLDASALAEEIVQAVNAPGIIDDALVATSGIAHAALADVAGLPASILGAVNWELAEQAIVLPASLVDTVGGELADLPSGLLGNDGPEGAGGFLSTLFYPDGGSESLAIPDLSDAAGSLVAQLGETTVGMLGISYVDMAEIRDGGAGINALGLL